MASLPTISATSLEDAFVELAQRIVAKQQDPDKNPDAVNFFTTFSVNSINGTMSFGGTIPVTQTVHTNGSIIINTDEPYID
ncbi:MAG TPA: hypothetical protein VLS94_06510 [Fusibacter sp.]|nr:hypothetical protein [Fusibacter sp.]